jgi:glycosyltransferase involved in cell wall biosynthesis
MRVQTPVLIGHPGAAHFIYEMVAAVEALGFDSRFETGFYYDPQGIWARLLALVPARQRGKIERELKRRSFDSIDARRVLVHPVPELAYVAAARLANHRPAVPKAVMAWRNRYIDSAIANRIRRERPRLFIGHDTSALRSFEAAKASGTLTVLNQMIGHLAVGDRILREEAELHPDWADSLHAGAPQAEIEQCLAEARMADAILSPSDYVTQTLIEVGVAPERIHLQPFGVRVDRFKPPEVARDDGIFRLLYVGQISQRKGLKYVLKAVKQIGDRSIELVLVGGLVGEGRGLKPYEGWYRHVRNVPHHDFFFFFFFFVVLLFPSLHEGSALAIFEGMATGLPVITTLNSGSMVRDGIEGKIVPIRSVDAIAEAILTLKNDADLRGALGRAARVRALGFTWGHYRDRLGPLLDGLLGIG